MGRSLHRLGAFTARHAVIVLIVWVILAVAMVGLVKNFGAKTNNNLSLPGTGSQQAFDILAAKFPPQENGTNPFSSCLPIILQMPIFFALFHVLKFGVADDNPIGPMTQSLVDSAAQATIFGAPISASFMDASQYPTEMLNIRIVSLVLIALMTLTTFITQKQLMVKGIANADSNPFLQQQKLLVYVFPFMFAIFGINFPIGVLIYWLTTNVWSMGQQYYVIRNNPAPGSQAFTEWEERQARKAAKRGGADGGAPTITEEAPAAEPEPKVVRNQPKRKPRRKRKGRTGGAEPSPNEETP